MSKYIATLTNERGDVNARNLFELQTALCAKLDVPPTVLSYHFLRTAALENVKERKQCILECLGIKSIRKTYKSVKRDQIND